MPFSTHSIRLVLTLALAFVDVIAVSVFTAELYFHAWYLFVANAAGLSCAVFLAMLVYFPAGPPSPPSQSAQAQRYKFREGLRNIVTSYPKLIIGI